MKVCESNIGIPLFMSHTWKNFSNACFYACVCVCVFRWLFQLFLYLKQESRISVGFAGRMRWVVLFFPGASTIS